MSYYELMSLPEKWDDQKQYKKQTLSNVLPMGFCYVLVPLVIYNSTIYYANSSSPAKAITPDSTEDWTLFCEQSSNSKESKEIKKKDDSHG